MNTKAVQAPVNLLANALYAGAVLLLLYALATWLLRMPVFALHHVDIRGQIQNVDEGRVRLVAGRGIQGNFFTVNLDKTRDAFEKLPWVKEAQVTRQWPDRLIVVLKEHQPLAVWNGKQLVSSEGEVFNAAPMPGLPHLSGQDGSAPQVSENYKKFSTTLASLGLTVDELSLSARQAWRLKTAQGLEIALGRMDAENRLARFAAMYPRLAEKLGAAPVYADLRYADGFALKVAAVSTQKPEHMKERS